MAIRQLSLTLNLDTGTFTQNARLADGAMKTLSRSIEETSRSAINNATALDGSVRAIRGYVENGLRLRQTQEQIRVSQDAYVKSLYEELKTMGLSASAMRDYTAGQLNLTEQTRELRLALDEKAATLRSIAEANRLAAEADRELSAAEAARLGSAEALLNSMREQIIVLRGGTEALALERAEALGCAEEYRALAAIVAELNAEEKAYVASQRAAAKATAGTVVELNASTRAAHANGRAIYELNVLSHELASGRIRQAISSFSILLNNIGLAAGATLGLTLSIGLLYGLSKPIEKAAQSMENLKLQSQQLGVSVGFLQTLEVASDLLGIKTDKLVAGIGRLDQSFARARAGSKLAASGFDAVGISLKDNYTNQQLVQGVLKGWDKLDDGPRKVAVATALFGRSGKDLIPVLNELAEKYSLIDAEATAYGLHNEKAVEVGAQLAEQFRQTSLAAKGFGLALLEAIGPGLLSFLKGMTEVTRNIGLFLKNGDDMKFVFQEIAIGAAALAAVFIGPMVSGFVASTVAAVVATNAFRAFAVGLVLTSEVGGLAGALGFLRTVMISLATEGVAALASGLALLLNPIVLIAGAASALAYMAHEADIAAHATEKFKGAQVSALSPMRAALDFSEKYGASTEGLTKAIFGLTGATEAGTTKTDAATEAAKARFEIEKALTEQLLRKAAAESRADAVSVQGAVKTNGFVNDISKFGLKVGAHGAKGSPEYNLIEKAVQDSEALNVKAAKEAKDGLALADQLSAQADAVSKTVFKASKIPKIGTTDGDPFGTHKGKANAALTALDDLKSKLAALQGTVDDTGSQFEKYTERLNNISDPLYKGVQGHKDLAKSILDTAKAVDAEGAAKKSKTAYEELAKQAASAHDVAVEAQEDLAGQVKGTINLAKARQDAARARLVEAAKNFTPKDGKPSAKTLSANIGTDITKADDAKDQSKTLEGFQKKLDEARGTADELWSQYQSGASKAQVETAKLKGELDKAIAAAKNPEARAALIDVGKNLLTQQGNVKGEEAGIDFRAKAKKINEELANDTIAKQKAIVTAEVQASYDRIKAMDFTTEQGKTAYADYVAYVKALNAQLATETPFGKLQKDWSDMTGNLEKAGANWINTFASQLAKGKLDFKAFSKSIIQDITEILLKATLAKYIIGPLEASLGLTPKVAPVSVGTAHTGGLAGEALVNRSVHPSVFLGAPRYHQGGIAGIKSGEVPAILQKGEGVFTQAQMKAMAGSHGGAGAPPVTINLQNQSGTPLDADHAGTNFDGEKFVLDVVVSHMGRPGALRSAIKSSQ
jgi:hypothetical protein